MERKAVRLSVLLLVLLNCRSGIGQSTKGSRIKGRPSPRQDLSHMSDVGFVCDRPKSPNGASMRCHQTNNELKCTAECVEGFHFPDTYPEIIELECDSNGKWHPDDAFPDCIGDNSGTYSTHYSQSQQWQDSHGSQISDAYQHDDVGLVCDRPKSPNGASMRCHQTNNELKCTAECIEGFHFPDTYPEIIELECDSNGEWHPDDSFPDCIGENSGSHYSQSQQWQNSHQNQIADVYQQDDAYDYGGFNSMGGFYESACTKPPSPNGGSMNCSQRNEEMSCSATCNEGFNFPDNHSLTIQITCDINGDWDPYDRFPDCIGQSSYGQGYSTYGQSQSRYGQGQSSYGQSQSSYAHEQSGYGQGQSSYGQGQSSDGQGQYLYDQGQQLYGNLCTEPPSPSGGSMNCVQRNGELFCSAICMEGFSFPDSYPATIEITCDINGDWDPYDEFPDCIDKRSSSHDQYYQTQQRHSDYNQASYLHNQEQQIWQEDYDDTDSLYSSDSSSSLSRGCIKPAAPRQGTIYCMDNPNQRQCQATCNPGYEFPDRTRQIMLTCDFRSGYWMPKSKFDDCGLLCHPPCQNGGHCGHHGECSCPGEYRGNRCQYPIALCDFNRLHTRMVAFECSHNSEFSECHVSCPPGMIFDPPSTSLYRCTVDGLWNPPTAPSCVKNSACSQPPSPMNGRIMCTGNNEKLLCTGSCRQGYQFPDGFNELVIQCSYQTGQWSPTVNFDDCIPICNPPCQNGGVCRGHNQCICTPEYRGSKCEYAISNCDYNAFLVAVVTECRVDQEETVCHVSCGNTGAKLIPSQPTVYTCGLDGTWSPAAKPTCESDYSHMDRRTGTRKNNYEYSEYEQRYSYQNSSRSNMNYGEFSKYRTGSQADDNNLWQSKKTSGYGYGDGSSEFTEGRGYDSNILGQGQGGHDLSWEDINLGLGQETMDYDFNQSPRPEVVEGSVSKGQFSDNFSIKGNRQIDTYKDTRMGGRGIKRIVASSHKGVCSVWGRTHIRTFDGTVYDFPGTCSYILVKDTEHEERTINLVHNCDYYEPELNFDPRIERMRETESSEEECVREIEIRFPEEIYKLSPLTNITLNGNPLSIPVRRATGVLIEKVSHYIVAKYSGYSIWMSDEGTIRIMADSNKRGKTSGLCGNFDHLDDDFQSPEGQFMNDITTFGNSWKTVGSRQNCFDKSRTHSPCQADTVKHRMISDKASLMCESLRSMEYESCHQLVNPQDYYAMCQIDCCSTDTIDGCECSSLGEYFKECARAGGDMRNGWRRPALCPLTCSNGTEYRECGPACRPTCERQDPPCSYSKCVDGCFCPEGTVLEDGQCIPLNHCPCSHGKSKYASGDVMQNDCNTCICQGGVWLCTEEICPATCYVSGPHFTTFDGTRYYLHSKCANYLVYGGDFSISIDYSTNCRELESTEDKEPICVRSISILTPENTIVKLKPGFEVIVNGEEIDLLPVTVPGVHVGQSTSIFMKAILKSGLEILWDGGQQVFVSAPVSLYDNIRGLCGTFNHQQSNDFLTPDGDIESFASNFAEKWKVDSFCDDGDKVDESVHQSSCDKNADRYDDAAAACSILKDDQIFKECHDFVDPTPYYTSCMEDICDCQLDEEYCLCMAIASYAAVCARKGHPVSWRSEIPECAIQCSAGQVYTDCAKSCSYSCAEIAKPREECNDGCVEGCVCPPGQTMDEQEHRCVSVSSCHCSHSGRSFPPEFRQRRGHEMCECAEGQWSCHNASATDLLLNPPTTAIECSSEAHMVATDCVSQCPLTCSNREKHVPCTVITCEAGCKCEDGYVFDGASGKCILPNRCPCYHAGHSFTEGTEFKIECNDCVCNGGHWDCQSNPCPGLCSVWGNSHYKTFDGHMFDFQGECNYELLRGPSSDNSAVSVVVHNLPCGTGGVTCGKAITISLGDESVTLTKDDPIPDVELMSGITVNEIGMFIIVHVDDSISVQWDRDTRIYITAQPIWKSKLLGLCGDFNGDATDDFKPPSGGIPLTLAEEFADSWKVYDYCSPATNTLLGCENNSDKRFWAREKCSVMQMELFKPCHTLVDSEEYYRRCMYDACACDIGGDCVCLCEAVAAYAQECARKGVSIQWRSQELCPIQCEECDHYSPCIEICEPLNCENYQDDIVSTCTFEPCVEGCEPKNCPAGFVRTGPANKTCINIKDCSEKPCTVLNGIAYKDGARISDPDVGDMCQSCFCHEGEISCEGLPCTTTPFPTTLLPLVECEDGWSDWLNSAHPDDNDGNDHENLNSLLSSHRLPCDRDHIKKVECREVMSWKPSEYTSKGQIICDIEQGLKCDRTDTDDCSDHEIRVFCKCMEEEICPPDHQYDHCAFQCGSMCHSLEVDYEINGQCDEEDKCIPGCVDKICKPPFLRRDAETCVLAESCTCKLNNGTLLAPGLTGVEHCQKCQCVNNGLLCMTSSECEETPSPILLTSTTPFVVKTSPPTFTTPIPLWTTSSTIEPLVVPFTKPPETLMTPPPILMTELPMSPPAGFILPEEVLTTTEVTLIEEITTTPKPKTSTPSKIELLLPFVKTTTVGCSYWSNWINNNTPKNGRKGGEREDTLPFILTQTIGFCQEGVVTNIECEAVETGLDYTRPNDEDLICDLDNGFICNNRDQVKGYQCQDYKIRYYCTCETVETTTIFVQITTQTHVYPCSDFTALIDGYTKLPDSSLKASSSRSPNEGPESARLSTHSPGRKGKMALLGGSWTAAVEDEHQHIEVELGDVNAIYGIKTKGKAGSNDWVTAYAILYSTDGASYNYYEDGSDHVKIFTGNYDSSTEVKHIFEEPFEARYVRIEPVNWENSISLRFDVLGCAEVAASTTPIPGEYITTERPITPKEEVCKDPMGLENGLLSDFQLSASSARDPLTSAAQGRLGAELTWIPSPSDQNPYLQVDFLDLKNISGVITQGSDEEDAWVTAFKVQYSKDGKTWNKVTDGSGYSKEFPANYDGYSPVTNLLPGMIRTRFLRVIPTNSKNSIALQIEVMGCYHPEECQKPMGIEKSRVDNNQMSASSEKEEALSAEMGRLNSLKAWSPISADKNQFLQVDFLRPVNVTGVVTKGRNEALEWVKEYEVSYSNNKKKWDVFKNEDGDIVKFSANTDTDTAVTNLLPELITARYIRIKPTRWTKWPSLRIELLGCLEEKEECTEPMGIENGLIKDSQIISSSDYDHLSKADQARIKSESAWSPNPTDKFPFLEIDFRIPQDISAIVTKGRENGLPEGWVTSYKIAYKNEQNDFELFRDNNNEVEIFDSNEDEDSPVVNVLGEDPLMATAIQIIPLTWEGAPNLRVEVLGCFHPIECQEPMGMENEVIMDSQLSASSSLGHALDPDKARINSDSGWSAGTLNDEQFIMVDLMDPRNVTGLLTSGHGMLEERVISYIVEYSTDGVTWKKVTRNGEIAEFSGSHETNLNQRVLSAFEEPITTRYVKIRPTDFENWISIRFEVFGCFHDYVCKQPMGLESGFVTDSQITASSYFNESTSPFHSRLSSGSSWIPAESDKEPYLQIEFNLPKNVTAIITQGNPNEDQYVTAYLVMHSDDGTVWNKVMDESGRPMEFKAYRGNYGPVINVLPQTLETRFIRIMPIDWNDRVALQIELLGCSEEVLELTVLPTEEVYAHECPDPDVKETSLMENVIIKASSSAPNSSPYLALLNTQADIPGDRTGGWVPKVGDMYPYLIIEFPETRLLTAFSLQGRQDADQRVKYFKIMASIDNSTWLPVFDTNGNEIIEGNIDSASTVSHYFKAPVNAKYVKVIPEEWHKWPSLRLDLIGCYHPIEVTTSVVVPPALCPEIPFAMRILCPDTCGEEQLCNGKECVDAADCSCLKDGREHEVGSIFHTEECEKCQCLLGGNSKCTKKDCPPCLFNKMSYFGPKCECECKKCPEDTIVCPTSGECLPPEKWCDGIVDCPDDEQNCPTTISIPETTIKPTGIVAPAFIIPETSTIPPAVALPTAFSITTKTTTKKPTEIVGPGLFITPEATTIPPTTVPPITVPLSAEAAKPLILEMTTTTTPASPPPIIVPDTCEIEVPHIKLFDGQNILYKPCHHVVITDIVNERFDVIMHNSIGNRSIEVTTEDHKVKITAEKNVQLDGHEYSTSQLEVLNQKPEQSLIIEILGEHVIVKDPGIGFEIVYNTLGQLNIKVLPSLKNQIAGLCGFYSDSDIYALQKPDKTDAFTNKEFGDSWATGENKDDCKEPVCDIETRSLGMEACNELKSDDFLPCAAVLDIKDYMYTCQEFMCECLDKSEYEDCKCKILTQMIEKCMTKLGEDVLKGWRVKHQCPPPPCPEGFVWEDCGPSCQITCGTLTSADFENCSNECMSGCFCPTGTLLDRETCVPPDKCSNEVCHGFGDPHMETFDGYFFPMQAEGTFLFAADEGSEFAVQGITQPCRPGSKRVTCITGIKVTHYGHTVTVGKNEKVLVNDEEVTVEKWPLNVYGMTVIGYPGKTYVVLISSLSVDVRYYGDNSGFAIKIPATRFFNRTLGLCGNCDGKVSENPKKEYACGWLVKGSNESCMESFTNLPPTVEVVNSCLALMDDEIFGTCHALVNPQQYIDACSFDVTYTGEETDSVCKTLKEYSRQCCQAGVVIDKWPEKFDCDVGCENNLEYSSCHNGCPQTCESTKNNFLVLGCEKIMLDGCFCPEGTVFKDGKCIESELCDACDDEGHMPGDSWSPETCKTCTCRSNLLTECSTETCPAKPICTSDESLVKQNLQSPSCCDSFLCVLSPVFCPPVEDIPSCAEGEIVKTDTDEDLCPQFNCVCDPVTCAPVTFPQDLQDGQVANVNKEDCCPKISVECDSKTCPEKPECTPGLIPVEYEGECCILFRCKPPTDVCVYTPHYVIVNGQQVALEAIEREPVFYQPRDTWQDGLCENCTCAENNGQLRPLCIMEQCPTVQNMPENKDYELVEYPNPLGCCPDIFKLHCKDEYGNMYLPGEEWQSEEDPCINFMCELTEKEDALKSKKVISCPECPKTSDYVPPSVILGQCCGFCRPTKCEEDSKVYVIGEEWVPESMPCRKAQCVNDFGSVKIVYTETSCPVIPEDCPTDKIIDDELGCCRICNETTEMKCNSVPIPVEETIGFFQIYDPTHGGQCQNTEAVPEIMKCSGACHSQSYYSVEDGDFKSVCQCCKVNITVERMVEMVCPDGSILKKEYLQPQTCQCSKCGPDKKKDIWVTSGKKHSSPGRIKSPWLQNNGQESEDDFRFPGQMIQQEEENNFGFPGQRIQEDDDNFGFPGQRIQEEDNFGFPGQRIQEEEDNFGFPGQRIQEEEDNFGFLPKNIQQEENIFGFPSQNIQQEEDNFRFPRQNIQEKEDYFRFPQYQSADDYSFYSKRSLHKQTKSLKDADFENTNEDKLSTEYQEEAEEKESNEMKKRMSPFLNFKMSDTRINSNDYGSYLSSLYEEAKEKIKEVELPSLSSLYEEAKEKVKDVELPDFSTLYEKTKKFEDIKIPSFLRQTREARKR